MRTAVALAPTSHRPGTSRRRTTTDRTGTRGPRYTLASIEYRVLGRLGVAVLLVAALSVAVLSVTARPEAPTPEEWTTVSVDPNGTLWQLAEAHPVDGLDTASTVDLILTENRLSSSQLSPGQTLRVPTHLVTATAVAQR